MITLALCPVGGHPSAMEIVQPTSKEEKILLILWGIHSQAASN